MEDFKETNRLLKKIVELLAKNEARKSTDDLTAEGDKLIEKAKKQGEDASNKIQTSFDRIHDKLFTINSVLVASYFGLGKFPSEQSVVNLWLVILPIITLFFLVFLEQQQMEIHRHASNRMNWKNDYDMNKYGKMIKNQNLKSLLAIAITFILFIYLAIKIIIY